MRIKRFVLALALAPLAAFIGCGEAADKAEDAGAAVMEKTGEAADAAGEAAAGAAEATGEALEDAGSALKDAAGATE